MQPNQLEVKDIHPSEWLVIANNVLKKFNIIYQDLDLH